MEELVKATLGCTQLDAVGCGGGGDISNGQAYSTDTNGRIYVKHNPKEGARLMFDGEYASLTAIENAKLIKVPKPIAVCDNPKGGAVLIMEYLDMDSLRSKGGKLGEQLAKLHLQNEEELKKKKLLETSVHSNSSDRSAVEQFGFDIPTSCGYLPQDNSWKNDWVEFYAQNKLGQQINMITKEYGDREAVELWGKLQRKLPELFTDISQRIRPALVHGDLWGGNVAEWEGEPVIFDAASFYGHSEFDLGIAKMFGGFPQAFWMEYHRVLPKEPGFDKRNELYQLFHYLNHWNHFGGGYRGSSISIMRQLTK